MDKIAAVLDNAIDKTAEVFRIAAYCICASIIVISIAVIIKLIGN